MRQIENSRRAGVTKRIQVVTADTRRIFRNAVDFSAVLRRQMLNHTIAGAFVILPGALGFEIGLLRPASMIVPSPGALSGRTCRWSCHGSRVMSAGGIVGDHAADVARLEVEMSGATASQMTLLAIEVVKHAAGSTRAQRSRH